MTFDEWEAHYKPITNIFDTNASFEGIMFETYGIEYAQVCAQPVNNIWTLIDGEDGEIIIVAGLRFVNRIGYFITTEPWADEFMQIEIEQEKGDE